MPEHIRKFLEETTHGNPGGAPVMNHPFPYKDVMARVAQVGMVFLWRKERDDSKAR